MLSMFDQLCTTEIYYLKGNVFEISLNCIDAVLFDNFFLISTHVSVLTSCLNTRDQHIKTKARLVYV